MRRALVLSLLTAVAVPTPALAKTFERLVVVGAAGDSAVLDRPRALVGSLNDGASRFNRGHVFETVVPHGSFVRIYPLSGGGHVSAPGRFYPRASAVCVSWRQAERGACWRANPTLAAALRSLSRRLVHFRGRAPTLARLENPRLSGALRNQLRVAIVLAFDRQRLALSVRKPRHCISLRASWRHDQGRRPDMLCLSRRGVYARGALYPLGPEPWRLAALNLR